MSEELVVEAATTAEATQVAEESQQVEKSAEATAAEQHDESADDPAAEAKKSKGGFQRRIDELTRQREEERREKERLLSLVERLSDNGRPQKQETQSQGLSEPKREDFDDYEQFIEARAEFRAVKAVEARFKEQEQRQQQATQQSAQAKTLQDWNAKVSSAREKYADFDDAVAVDVPISKAMSEAMLDSDKGAEVAYYLAKNPSEAARIAALSPNGQIREIGKLEDRVAKPVKASSAPDPIRPVGARSVGSDPLSDTLPMSQWAENFKKSFYKGR